MNHRDPAVQPISRLIVPLLLVLVVILLGACAGRNTPPAPPGSLAARFQSDTALFEEGYAQLRGQDRPVDYGRARAAFSLMLAMYPNSKWRDYAESYLRLMSELQSLRNATQDFQRQRQADREAAAGRQAEMERELRELRPQMEKIRTEASRLQQENQSLRQENDRLKRDIDSLKRLEVEMQRRDKLYR